MSYRLNRSVKRVMRLPAAILLLFASLAAIAHEIRPAYLEINLAEPARIHITWKQPVTGDVALPLRPTLSSGWLDPAIAAATYTETYLIRRWTIAAPSSALTGQRLTIEGLQPTLTDALVRVVFADGAETIHVIKPDAPSWVLPSLSHTTPAISGYLTLGIEHIWTGVDHLCFVLGLLLLATGFRELLKTITAFTAAHSITLAAAALGVVSVPAAPMEAIIALSVVYLAVELVSRQSQAAAPVRPNFGPWPIALLFGLLHGFGFAGALGAVGLPAQNIPLALLLFNLGIEIGQILFVCGVLLVLKFIAKSVPRVSQRLEWSLPHAIGSLAAFWFIDRTLAAFA